MQLQSLRHGFAVPPPFTQRRRIVSANIILKCHSEQKRCVWENKKRVRRICDGVASLIFLRGYVFYFPLYVSCCRKAAKILRLILCAPLKGFGLRMTEWCVNIDCSRVACAVTIPPSRLRRATSLYTKEANWLVRTLFKMSF